MRVLHFLNFSNKALRKNFTNRFKPLLTTAGENSARRVISSDVRDDASPELELRAKWCCDIYMNLYQHHAKTIVLE
ncbi:hypothetical protein TNCV_5082821 [Trichonephila clavipes]|nr:hypothetical protein TNCV_5082821 [Trichonephila clavipes]